MPHRWKQTILINENIARKAIEAQHLLKVENITFFG